MVRGVAGEMITGSAGKFYVTSSKGKNLGGPYRTRAQAQKRLRMVEYFKHRDKGRKDSLVG
jgi:hypothetical protein